MPNFVFAYHGGEKPETDEEVAEVMADWKNWMSSMAGSIVDMGNHVGMSKTVTADGVEDHGGSNPLSGFTVVSANDIDGAIEMAKGCPILKSGSTVEVAEAIEIDM